MALFFKSGLQLFLDDDGNPHFQFLFDETMQPHDKIIESQKMVNMLETLGSRAKEDLGTKQTLRNRLKAALLTQNHQAAATVLDVYFENMDAKEVDYNQNYMRFLPGEFNHEEDD